MNQLVDYILDGDADKLKDRSSDDEEVQELIDGVPKFEVVLIVRTTATYKKFSRSIDKKSSNISTYSINRKELQLSTKL